MKFGIYSIIFLSIWLAGRGTPALAAVLPLDVSAPIATSRYGPAPAPVAFSPATLAAPQPTQAAAGPAPQREITVAAPAQAQPANGPPQDRLHNPFGRDVDLTMSLVYSQRDLGELPVTLTRDNRVFVHTTEFIELISPLLSPSGKKDMLAAIGRRAAFEPESLLPAGVTLAFDPSALSVVVLKIDPQRQAQQTLYPGGRAETEQTPVQPARFSAYINVNAATTWADGIGVTPYLDLQGVLHFGRVVLESDFTGQDFASVGSPLGAFQLQRDYVRLVYDRPEADQRFYLGDLSPQFRGLQSAVELGGVGVLRQTRIFDPARVATLTNTQQLVLNSDSTVDIIRNGALLQQLHLAAGSYNLNNLPLTTGSNNVQIQVHGVNGLTQVLNYSTYLDPIDLLPGDYEYGAFAGVLSTTSFNTPVYGDDPVFTGFYRKAFLNSNAFGIGLQADRHVQMADGEYRWVLPGGSRIEIEGAVSDQTGGGAGGSVSIGFDRVVQRGAVIDAFDARATYNTTHFASVESGVVQAINPQEWELSASYSHTFNPKLEGLANAFVSHDRVQHQYGYSATVEAFYQLSKRWQVTAGVSYQNLTEASTALGPQGTPAGQFGAIISLVWRPDAAHRVQADYDGSRDTESLSVSRSRDDYVGDWGYDAIVQGAPGGDDLSVEAEYVANRFDLSVEGDTNGDTFGTLTSQKSVTARVGTSLAFVDGHFAVGAPIADSFVIAYPHPTLDNRSVIVGDDLQNGHYNARSDALGPALYGALTSYTINTAHYDVLNPPPGYDIGTGTLVMRPTYRSGFALQVGNDAFISATGTLVGNEGQPFALVSGHVVSLDDPKEPMQLFFTNSVGRFAIESLKPGRRYRVLLNRPESPTFTFETPKTGAALVDLKTVTINAPSN